MPEILKKPEPPKAKPPQVPPQKEEMAKLPDLTLPKPSKINLPKPPEINLPKPSAFNLPNPPDLSVPKTPVPPKEPPTKESKSKPSDNFVFSEVSLKDFVDDVRTTDKASMKSNEDRRAEEVALAKKRALEAKQAAAAKKRIQEQQAAAVAKQKKIENKQRQQAMGKAKPGATISLGLFGGSAANIAPASGAPPGVPTLSRWKRNRDGSLSGFISGSTTFRNGDSVTTSPIKGTPVGGSVATTVSGSK